MGAPPITSVVALSVPHMSQAKCSGFSCINVHFAHTHPGIAPLLVLPLPVLFDKDDTILRSLRFRRLENIYVGQNKEKLCDRRKIRRLFSCPYIGWKRINDIVETIILYQKLHR